MSDELGPLDREMMKDWALD